MSTPITSFKGFTKDLTCTGGGKPFQYVIGQAYEHPGDVLACSAGFHACEHPLDVLNYYPPGIGSRFAVVEQSGTLSRKSGSDTKVASSRLVVKAELTLAGLIKAAIEYTFSRANPVDPNSPASATGTRGAASATGDSGAASVSGEHSAAMASGHEGRVMGVKGCALFLVYRDPSTGAIKHAAAVIVGKTRGVKPGKWYRLTQRGRVVEVKS